MEEQKRRCKWCGCHFSLSVLRFGDYCSPACYYQAKQAEKAHRKSQQENKREDLQS